VDAFPRQPMKLGRSYSPAAGPELSYRPALPGNDVVIGSNSNLIASPGNNTSLRFLGRSRPSQRLSVSDNETSHGSPGRGEATVPEPTSFVRIRGHLVTTATLPIRAWSLAGLLRLLEDAS